MIDGSLTPTVGIRWGVRDELDSRDPSTLASRVAAPQAFVNRELSWLEFNRRVLEEAEDPTVPLLERVKFLSIFSSNLDEFFMIRVAGLKRQAPGGAEAAEADGLTPAQTLSAVSQRVHELVQMQHRCFLRDILPLLSAEGVEIVRPTELSQAQAQFVDEYYHRMLLPVVMPLAIDPSHPFPRLVNRALYLVVSLRATAPSALPPAALAVVHIPAQVVPRFVALPAPKGKYAFILLEDVIRLHLPELYRGYEVLSCQTVRVTRDADIQLPEPQAEDLLTEVEAGLRQHKRGAAVRLQYDPDLPAEVLARLVDELDLQPDDLYSGEGFTAFTHLAQLYSAVDLPHLKDRPLVPHAVTAFENAPDVWSAIRAGDIIVHHPYHTFDAVTRFVHEAARDPKVLAINMTLYRVSLNSPIAQGLILAAEAGKEVVVLVELRARFDEEANIRWARALERVGAHVVYGLAGYKTHGKACLVVRQEADGLRRYCHLATGNYNVRTGGIYEDFGLFTCREAFGEDLTELFNLLTGYTRPKDFNHLVIAPTGLREFLVGRIRREAVHARAGRPARVIAKMNSLVDPVLIEELYAASKAGVQIDLIVRSICCLRPGMPDLSDRIKAISIVDRYLEHARVYYFENGGEPEYWLGSADWMPRNLDDRVEVAFPVIDPALQRELRQVLDIQLADTEKARAILPDGRSERIRPNGRPSVRSQVQLYELAGSAHSVAQRPPAHPADAKDWPRSNWRRAIGDGSDS
jgi:polyphosphate kinase